MSIRAAFRVVIATMAVFLISTDAASGAPNPPAGDSWQRHGAQRPPGLPAGVPYQPPPRGAPPEPAVPYEPSLLGVGNVSGFVIHPNVKVRKIPIGEPASSARTTSGGTRSAGTSCASWVYQYASIYQPVAVGNPSYVESVDTAAWSMAVQNPTNEHINAGIIDWQNSNGWVQMGYQRGNSQTWTDELGSNQTMIYMEFISNPPAGYYNWVPLAAVDQGSRHTFTITQDESGYYYNFYLDGNLKWANVYQAVPEQYVDSTLENFTTTDYCNTAVADNNFFNVPMRHVKVVDPGLAFGVSPQEGPWQSDVQMTENLMSSYGFVCGQDPGGNFWWCG